MSNENVTILNRMQCSIIHSQPVIYALVFVICLQRNNQLLLLLHCLFPLVKVQLLSCALLNEFVEVFLLSLHLRDYLIIILQYFCVQTSGFTDQPTASQFIREDVNIKLYSLINKYSHCFLGEVRVVIVRSEVFAVQAILVALVILQLFIFSYFDEYK